MYRISELLKIGNRLFSTQDLRIIWQVENNNTLYTTVKRYIQKGVLYRVYKGLYSVIPIDELSDYELGTKLVRGYTYLSTESVLVKHGIMFQEIFYTTFVAGVTKKIEVDGRWFRYRRMREIFLYNPVGIERHRRHDEASLERALADLWYYNPKAFVDNLPKNMQKIKKFQKEVGYI